MRQPNGRNFPLAYPLMDLPDLLAHVRTSRREMLFYNTLLVDACRGVTWMVHVSGSPFPGRFTKF